MKYAKILDIAERAETLYKELSGKKRAKINWVMDIHGCLKHQPVNLDGLIKADDSNFGHDVFGIMNNINHETDRLENGFLPRFSL